MKGRPPLPECDEQAILALLGHTVDAIAAESHRSPRSVRSAIERAIGRIQPGLRVIFRRKKLIIDQNFQG